MSNLKEKDLKTEFDAVVHYIENLDEVRLSEELSNYKMYNGFSKSMFVFLIGEAFVKFASAGDSHLISSEGYCGAETCNYKCTGFSFKGNSSGCYMNMVIEEADGKVVDITECVEFCLIDEEKIFSKEKLIRIDTTEKGVNLF